MSRLIQRRSTRLVDLLFVNSEEGGRSMNEGIKRSNVFTSTNSSEKPSKVNVELVGDKSKELALLNYMQGNSLSALFEDIVMTTIREMSSERLSLGNLVFGDTYAYKGKDIPQKGLYQNNVFLLIRNRLELTRVPNSVKSKLNSSQVVIYNFTRNKLTNGGYTVLEKEDLVDKEFVPIRNYRFQGNKGYDCFAEMVEVNEVPLTLLSSGRKVNLYCDKLAQQGKLVRLEFFKDEQLELSLMELVEGQLVKSSYHKIGFDSEAEQWLVRATRIERLLGDSINT